MEQKRGLVDFSYRRGAVESEGYDQKIWASFVAWSGRKEGGDDEVVDSI